MKVEIPAEGRHSPEIFEADTAEELIEKLVSSKGHATAKIVELDTQVNGLEREVDNLQQEIEQTRELVLSFHRLLRALKAARQYTPAIRQTIDGLCQEIEQSHL